MAVGNETLPPALDHAVEEEPTRRCLVTDHVANTDLRSGGWHDEHDITVPEEGHHARAPGLDSQGPAPSQQIGDRKSTRLNSSHLVISYAVFCLKKKKKT